MEKLVKIKKILLCLSVLFICSCTFNEEEKDEKCTTQEELIRCTHDFSNIDEAIKRYKEDRNKHKYWVTDSLFDCVLTFLIKKRDNGEEFNMSYLLECLGESNVSNNKYGIYLNYYFYEKNGKDTICSSTRTIIFPNEKTSYFYMDCLE